MGVVNKDEMDRCCVTLEDLVRHDTAWMKVNITMSVFNLTAVQTSLPASNLFIEVWPKLYRNQTNPLNTSPRSLFYGYSTLISSFSFPFISYKWNAYEPIND